MRTLRVIKTIAFILFPYLLFSQVSVTVLAVHDGDSYKVRYQDGTIEWIRLWGVDCPEVISNHITKNQPFGVQAGNHVRNMIKGKVVTLDTLGSDIYSRTIAKVMIDTIDLTTYLVLNGYAWAYPTKNKEVDAVLKVYQSRAKQSKLGLWGIPGRKLRPDTFRKRNWRE